MEVFLLFLIQILFRCISQPLPNRIIKFLFVQIQLFFGSRTNSFLTPCHFQINCPFLFPEVFDSPDVQPLKIRSSKSFYLHGLKYTQPQQLQELKLSLQQMQHSRIINPILSFIAETVRSQRVFSCGIRIWVSMRHPWLPMQLLSSCLRSTWLVHCLLKFSWVS